MRVGDINSEILGDTIPDRTLYERVQDFLHDCTDPELSDVLSKFPELSRDESEIIFGAFIWEHKLVTKGGNTGSQWSKDDVESFLKARENYVS